MHTHFSSARPVLVRGCGFYANGTTTCRANLVQRDDDDEDNGSFFCSSLF